MNYKAEIDLSMFTGAEVRALDMLDGTTKRCVVIPMEDNSIKEWKTSVKAHVKVIERKTPRWGQTHFIVVEWDKRKAAYNYANEIKPPIIGSMTPFFMATKMHDESQERESEKDNSTTNIDNILGI